MNATILAPAELTPSRNSPPYVDADGRPGRRPRYGEKMDSALKERRMVCTREPCSPSILAALSELSRGWERVPGPPSGQGRTPTQAILLSRLRRSRARTLARCERAVNRSAKPSQKPLTSHHSDASRMAPNDLFFHSRRGESLPATAKEDWQKETLQNAGYESVDLKNASDVGIADRVAL
jgi:hypothetical protein